MTEADDSAAGAGVLDRTAPTVQLDLVPYDGTLFELGWHVEDASGIPDEGVELWIRIDGGEWLPYLTGQPASASTFIEGEPGARYHFGAYAIDGYGNASDLDPDAIVEIVLSDTSSGR
jgi:hypothetical protein